MADQVTYDVCVIGSGPGGYVAAIRAAQLGLRAVVIEKDKPGGVCLNIGCIPSKALIHQAALVHSAQKLTGLGIQVDLTGFDYKKIYAKSRQAADRLSKGVRYLLDKNKIPLIENEVVKVEPGSVTLKDGMQIKAKNILIATGSRPRELPGFEFDEDKILSSTGALLLQQLPKRMLVLGSGAIGVEFAHIMNAFGVDVHLVEILDRILPLEDDEVVNVLASSFRKRGVSIYTSTKALSCQKTDRGVQVLLQDKDGKQQTLEFDQLLVSAGRLPNTVGLGLAEAGIRLDDSGYIRVGDFYQTDVPGIYAVGDVVKSPLLAHVASREGEIAVSHMASQRTEAKIDALCIPAATYCEPQIASFGLTERQAAEKGIAIHKAVFPYRGAGKAIAIEQPDGLVKILTDPTTGEILGAHVAGAEATELIHELLLAKTAELLPEDVINMIHAHPTLSESIREAMLMVDGQAINI